MGHRNGAGSELHRPRLSKHLGENHNRGSRRRSALLNYENGGSPPAFAASENISDRPSYRRLVILPGRASGLTWLNKSAAPPARTISTPKTPGIVIMRRVSMITLVPAISTSCFFAGITIFGCTSPAIPSPIMRTPIITRELNFKSAPSLHAKSTASAYFRASFGWASG